MSKYVHKERIRYEGAGGICPVCERDMRPQHAVVVWVNSPLGGCPVRMAPVAMHRACVARVNYEFAQRVGCGEFTPPYDL